MVAIPLAMFLGLAGCGKPSASGTYVAKDASAVALIELVQSKDGEVTGRLELISLKPDGTLADNNAKLTGVSDGALVSLTVQQGLLFPASTEITGKFTGDQLALSGANAISSTDFVRSDIATFQKEAARLHQQSASILAAQAAAQAERTSAFAAAQAQQQVANARARLQYNINQLTMRMDQFTASLDTARENRVQIAAKYANATERMSALLDRERALVGDDNRAVQRGQLDGAINQLAGAMNQFHVNVVNGTQQLTGAGQQLVADFANALVECQRIGTTADDPALANACSTLASNSARVSALRNQRDQALQALEAAFDREASKQQQIVAEADHIA